jgi:hypothetical protein
MAKSYNFKIPNPRGLNAYTPTKFQDGRAKSMLNQKPTDKNQCAPTESEPVRRGYRMAGGC